MPYLIESWSLNIEGNAMLLRDINTQTVFNTKKETVPVINALFAEQKEDNNKLMGMYAEQLYSQLMDLDTNDRILREPKPYAYYFRAAKYTKAQIKRIP